MVVHARTGGDFEREVLGVSFRDVPETLREKRIRNFRAGVEFVRSIQPQLGGWNSRFPSTQLARSLFDEVSINLRRSGRELRLYNAIGTRLDLMGVDCFFELKGRIVTIDLTINPHKHRSRSNLVLHPWHFIRDEHVILGRLIAARLTSRFRRSRN